MSTCRSRSLLSTRPPRQVVAERRGLEPHPGCDPEQKRLTSRLRHLTALRSAGEVTAANLAWLVDNPQVRQVPWKPVDKPLGGSSPSPRPALAGRCAFGGRIGRGRSEHFQNIDRNPGQRLRPLSRRVTASDGLGPGFACPGWTRVPATRQLGKLALYQLSYVRVGADSTAGPGRRGG
jgi:hypothetical protein